jgi:hypothetical protein
MTRQHFQAIADTIKNLPLSDSDRHTVAIEFCDMLKGQNSRFDAVRFLKACEVTK